MPMNYHIYRDARLLLIIGEGTITQAERIQTVLASLGNPNCASCDNALLDVTRSDSIPKLKELRELITIIREHLHRGGPRNLAIVTARPITFGIARTFEDMVSASTLALNVKVFSDLDQAWGWLEGDQPGPSRPHTRSL